MLLCQFLVLAGNRQFFCCGGKVLLQPEKKVLFCCGGKVLLRPEKKVLVVCLAGCTILSVFGSGDYDRKKKVHVLCNEFVLVLVKIDLIHFEHTICIS